MTNIGVRIYTTKPTLSSGEIETLSRQVASVKSLDAQLVQRGIQSRVAIISNKGINKVGENIINQGPGVVFAPIYTEKRKRRIHNVVGDAQGSGFQLSTDLINGFARHNRGNGWYGLMSSDFANKPDEVAAVLNAQEALFEKADMTNVGMLGIITGGNHDRELAQDVLSGKRSLNITNINEVFPNNSFSFVPENTRFSGLADGATGTIEINGKPETVGGNEDFLYGIREMSESGKYVLMLIDPYIAGERVGEVSSISSKYIRRKAVYQIYAERQFARIKRQEKLGLRKETEDLTLDESFSQLIDEKFFFVRVDKNGIPEILLTERQRSKGIVIPDTIKKI